MSNMASMLQDQPFKNREHVKAEIRRCAMANSILSFLSFLFFALGIIGDALKTTLGLTSLSWFLLAIFAIIHAIVPTLHLVVAKHFLGIEAESKK
jgi:ABC-type amino acid transport system permease subunit